MTKSADNLRSLLDSLDDIIDGESVTLSDIVESMGERSFATVLLIPALIMVSPISGIPGSPTVAAMLFGLISIQMLMGRAALWLPGFLGRLEIPADRFSTALNWLRRPAAWIDPVIRRRLTFLTDRPASYLAILCCVCIALTMPPLELLPFAASFASGTVALFATGLMARDGVFVILGYLSVFALIALVLKLI
jgi:hypothetical protein